MGIERFFNSLKEKFDIIKLYNNKLISSNYLFLDFNSIIHTESQNVVNILNMALKDLLLDSNRKDIKKMLEKISVSNEILDNIKSIDDYLGYFNIDLVENLIIKNIIIFVNKLIKNFVNLDLIYISIDGVPSKSKMMEQKKRSNMAEFDSNIKKLILEKHKNILNKNTKKFNKYEYLKNKVSWSKSNIKPGTSFMMLLEKELDKYSKKSKIEIYLDGFSNKGEAEKKIVNFINDEDNEINGNITIYSPDADMILLTLILKNKNIKRSIIRINTEKTDISNVIFDVIDIEFLEHSILKFFKKSKFKENIINDIVFIFTFFGDDFLPKMESINVKNDIEMILNFYRTLADRNKFILESRNNEIEVNFNNFLFLLKIFNENEKDMLKNNYLSKKYKNYNYLLKHINGKLNNHIYKKVNQSNIFEFIEDYNNKKNNMPKLNENVISLLKYSTKIEDQKIDLDIMDSFDIEMYKYEFMLDEYRYILNKEYYIKLGNPKYSYDESKKLYYKDFFLNENLSDICKKYLDGLQWILDYYFNDIVHQRWFYIYNKSPLISDIYKYLLKQEKYFFENCKMTLRSSDIISVTDELTPLEHFFYVTQTNDINIFKKFSNRYESKDKILELFKSLNDIYPDFKLIATNIFLKKNKYIDCRDILFLSKCDLNLIEDSNLIDEIKFKNIIREFVSIELQI